MLRTSRLLSLSSVIVVRKWALMSLPAKKLRSHAALVHDWDLLHHCHKFLLSERLLFHAFHSKNCFFEVSLWLYLIWQVFSRVETVITHRQKYRPNICSVWTIRQLFNKVFVFGLFCLKMSRRFLAFVVLLKQFLSTCRHRPTVHSSHFQGVYLLRRVHCYRPLLALCDLPSLTHNALSYT